MARKIRTTKTPRILSIVRRIMIYIGASGTFLTMTFTKLGIRDIDYALLTWGIALGLLQIVIDSVSSMPIKEDRFPTEAKNLRE